MTSCGESFIGLLMPMHLDEDREAKLTEWRVAWLRRLPEPTADTPVRVDLPSPKDDQERDEGTS